MWWRGVTQGIVSAWVKNWMLAVHMLCRPRISSHLLTLGLIDLRRLPFMLLMIVVTLYWRSKSAVYLDGIQTYYVLRPAWG